MARIYIPEMETIQRLRITKKKIESGRKKEIYVHHIHHALLNNELKSKKPLYC